MKNDTKLYNVLFPLWMLLLFPQCWLIVLPGNFLIDSIVFIVCMRVLKLEERRRLYKSRILGIFGFGLLADAVGAGFMILLTSLGVGTMGDEPYLTIPALVISAAMIFILDYFVTFKALDKKPRLALSLTFAIVTAPYTFLVPSSLLYH